MRSQNAQIGPAATAMARHTATVAVVTPPMSRWWRTTPTRPRGCGCGSPQNTPVQIFTIDTSVSNDAAIACYTSAGFRRVGILHGRERNTTGDGWHDTLLMSYCSWW